MDALQSVCITLAQFLERGHVPQELVKIDQMQYREIVHSPWRVIYQIDGNDVLVHAILDGHRDIQNLLSHRLTRPWEWTSDMAMVKNETKFQCCQRELRSPF